MFFRKQSTAFHMTFRAALPPTNVHRTLIQEPSSKGRVGICGRVGVWVQPSPLFGHQRGENSLMKCGTGPRNAISSFHICRKDETRFLILQWWCQWEYMTAVGRGAKSPFTCFLLLCSPFFLKTMFYLFHHLVGRITTCSIFMREQKRYGIILGQTSKKRAVIQIL